MKNVVELSDGAIELLEYIYSNKDGYFKGAFSISQFKGVDTNYLTTYIDELVSYKILMILDGIFGNIKYKLNEKLASKYLENVNEIRCIQEYRSNLEDEIRKYKRFIVTTAVNGKEVNKPFVDSIKNYAKRNDALVLLLPCEDVANRSSKKSPIELDSELEDFRVVFKDIYLNDNLCLCAIKMTAKQINSLTGLDRLPESRKSSIIVASTKIFLKNIANLHYDNPLALMSTGAITVNNYDTDRYMSEKTSTLAESDHMYGAIIVEIENNKVFYYRHVQPSDSGSFIDLGLEYTPDGSIIKHHNTAMVIGDSHVGYHDLELHEKVMELAVITDVTKVVLHDIFHGSSISHHDAKKSITRAIRALEGRLQLDLECEAVKNYIEDIEGRGFEIIIPQANHHNHLLKYLEDARYTTDPLNLKFASKLIGPAIDGINPLQYAIETILGFKSPKVHWLPKDLGYKIYGVEVGIHGDRGANGARGSLATFEKGVGNCVVAHSHSAAIHRKVFCVGTVGNKDMGYNEGLSNWTHTCCLIYDNGTKQLINFIENSDGDYSYKC